MKPLALVLFLTLAAAFGRAQAQDSHQTADAASPAKEDPAVAMPRKTEYPWMSVAGWNKRHEELKALAKQGGVDILFLGDSITERWADSATWRARYEHRKAANFGIGGDTTQNVLWRMEDGELDGINPKIVVLMIGTNNFGLRGDAPEDVARGATAVVKNLRRRFPDAKIVLIGLLPRGEKADDPFRAKIKDANARISGLDDGTHVRYLDFGPELLQSDGSLSKETAPDFLHIVERGYMIWADAMDPLLNAILGPPFATAPAR